MTYLILKALLSGLIVAIVSEIAKRSPGLSALGLPAARVRTRHDLAVARYQRYRADHKSRASNVLARATDTADAPRVPLATARRYRVLGRAWRVVPANGRALSRRRLAAGPLRDSDLSPDLNAHLKRPRAARHVRSIHSSRPTTSTSRATAIRRSASDRLTVMVSPRARNAPIQSTVSSSTMSALRS